MPHATKIATCCYCGTRAALVLRGKDRHELSCSGCGAPLHNLKQMPAPRQPEPRREHRSHQHSAQTAWCKPKRKSKRKSPFRKLFSEAIDVIEDIFD